LYERSKIGLPLTAEGDDAPFALQIEDDLPKCRCGDVFRPRGERLIADELR